MTRYLVYGKSNTGLDTSHYVDAESEEKAIDAAYEKEPDMVDIIDVLKIGTPE